MAHAIWANGRSASRAQQAATMLYVHSLMGDARPGEVDPAALGPEVVAIYRRVESDAERYHGPYRVEVDAPDRVAAGAQGAMRLRVLSATGTALPGVRLDLAVKGATDVPLQVTTNANGVAVATFTAGAGGVEVTATTEPIASTLPRIFAPTEPLAAINGQRLAAPSSQRVTGTRTIDVRKSVIRARTKATAATLLVGQSLRDKVFVEGAAETWRGTVETRIFGPFRRREEIRCDGTPAWTGTFEARGPGVYTTPYATMRRVGWYTYQQVIPGDAAHVGLTTPCRDPEETFVVDARPQVATVVSSDRIAPGGELRDTLTVTGTGGEALTVRVDLFGPFASRDAIRCDVAPVWTGTVAVKGDGAYETAPATLTVPGYYGYRETIAATDFVRPSQGACGVQAETSVVFGRPRIVTQVSEKIIAPGSTLSDSVVVTGLGALSATVEVELWGPYARRSEIDCTGTPAWRGRFVAAGDGTYRTAPVRIEKVGYYTYRESIEAAPPYEAVTTRCGEATETALARATPVVTTVVSNEVVAPGSRISDRIRVGGLGRTAARIEVELHGPFATRSAITCDGKPYWTGTVYVKGDGEVASPQVKLERAGFYTYRERLVGSPGIRAYETACGEQRETALSRPLVLTGRNERTRVVAARDAGARTPVQVRISRLGVSAPVAPVGIDVANDALAVPPEIRRTGWWLDGAAPGSRTGAVLIAGHVDSAREGAGAFFRLEEAQRGDRIEVVLRDGSKRGYRVTGVKKMLKAALPTDVYSLRGPARLVLVTCGGPFLAAEGRYRDNVVVTAVPV